MLPLIPKAINIRAKQCNVLNSFCFLILVQIGFMQKKRLHWPDLGVVSKADGES